MTLNDVLYTPLDCAKPPAFSIDELTAWINQNNEGNPYNRFLSYTNNFATNRMKERYPWKPVVPYFNLTGNGPGWIDNFDKKFPELSEYLYEAFNIPYEYLGLIVLLRVKPDQEGLGFWHNDPDSFGLRMYLDFEDYYENKLFIKKTKIPYNSRIGSLEEIHVQNEIHECKILKSNQCFYLNNVRSVHSIFTGVKNKSRITALILPKSGRESKVYSLVEDLIISSAEKFKNYSILY